MSFWMYKKGHGGRRSLYLFDIPWELSILLIGLILTLGVWLLRRLGIVL